MPTWVEREFDPTRECRCLCSSPLYHQVIIKSLADREASELECIVTGQTPALAGIAGVRLERCGCFVNQNMNFSASCNCRGVLAMLLTTPADP